MFWAVWIELNAADILFLAVLVSCEAIVVWSCTEKGFFLNRKRNSRTKSAMFGTRAEEVSMQQSKWGTLMCFKAHEVPNFWTRSYVNVYTKRKKGKEEQSNTHALSHINFMEIRWSFYYFHSKSADSCVPCRCLLRWLAFCMSHTCTHVWAYSQTMWIIISIVVPLRTAAATFFSNTATIRHSAIYRSLYNRVCVCVYSWNMRNTRFENWRNKRMAIIRYRYEHWAMKSLHFVKLNEIFFFACLAVAFTGTLVSNRSATATTTNATYKATSCSHCDRNDQETWNSRREVIIRVYEDFYECIVFELLALNQLIYRSRIAWLRYI